MSRLLFINDKFRGLLKYRQTYHNFFTVVMHVIRSKYPIDAILRNGNRITLYNRFAVSSIGDSRGREWVDYDIANDMVTVSPLSFLTDKSMKVRIYGGIYNGHVVSTFIDSSYHLLPVKGKTVIDIGANIGDTPIYFALRGASKVIGLEPFPKNYEMAKKNIELNNVSDRVTLLLAGCSANQGSITVDPNYPSTSASVLREFKQGISVPLLTLDDILSNYNTSLSQEIVLKIDCEGCEYETIASTSRETLQKFSYILIEYHYGYKNIKEKLEKSGFKVAVTRPIFAAKEGTDLSHFIGYIYAKLSNQLCKPIL
jgi:FkbM family methyltransferase